MLGSTGNLQPLFSPAPGVAPVTGILWVFSTCAFFFNGWQAALHAIEERRSDVSIHAAVSGIVVAIVVAALFYSGIVLAAARAVPWRTLIGTDLPAVAAFRALGAGGVLGTVLLIAAIVSLTKTWSAVAWIASRLLFAQARNGMLPRAIAGVDPSTGAPRRAVLIVTILTIIGVLMGRSAILPIVDMVAICLAVSIILCLFVLLRQRRLDRRKSSFTVPGGGITIYGALLGATAMVGAALLEPFWRGNGNIPPEWFWLAGWGVLGIVAWCATASLRWRAT
jgi:amino acid transporter